MATPEYQRAHRAAHRGGSETKELVVSIPAKTYEKWTETAKEDFGLTLSQYVLVQVADGHELDRICKSDPNDEMPTAERLDLMNNAIREALVMPTLPKYVGYAIDAEG